MWSKVFAANPMSTRERELRDRVREYGFRYSTAGPDGKPVWKVKLAKAELALHNYLKKKNNVGRVP